jgi:hypothetical protein
MYQRMRKLFQEAALPFGDLERVGLTREMIEDLPEEVVANIYDGGPSPVLPVRYTDEEGQTVYGWSRFSFVHSGEGEVSVLFDPRLDLMDLDELDPDCRESLKEGRVACGRMMDRKNGTSSPLSYFQVDADVRQVISVPMEAVLHNLGVHARILGLDARQTERLQQGKLVTLDDENLPLTLGIDLLSTGGVKVVMGNEDDWRRGKGYDWQKYNFGVYGCWVMNDDGTLDYVHDEDYTEEMWNEQKKQGLKQAHARTL